jgi:hypothetical protein
MVFLTAEEVAWTELFTTFEHTAFRLESRDAYAVDEEAEAFRQWRAGRIPQDEYRTPWFDTMRAAKRLGKRVERVRIVPDPLSDYLRFEAWLGKRNEEVGEDIRYLDRERAQELSIPYLNNDYWLFDSYRLYRLVIDEHDRLTGLEVIDDSNEVIRANRYRDVAWHYSTPFHQWYPAHAHECEPEQR